MYAHTVDETNNEGGANMNIPFPSRGQVEFTRSCYPPGTRIVLNSMNDPYDPVKPGTRGTVRYVDDAGQIGVAWDTSSLPRPIFLAGHAPSVPGTVHVPTGGS